MTNLKNETTPKVVERTSRFYNQKMQPIGELRNGVFRKVVRKSKHFMRIFNAWGIEAIAREGLIGKCEFIEIFEAEDKVVYRTPFPVFLAKAFRKDFETPQYFLEKEYWRITNAAGQLLQERAFLAEELQSKQATLGI
jgi:hypothetical protein